MTTDYVIRMNAVRDNSNHKRALPLRDPLIDEVRSIRKAISDQFGNDVDRLCDHLQQLEQEHTDRLIQPSAESDPGK